jgi:RNA-directed DNA polymerase
VLKLRKTLKDLWKQAQGSNVQAVLAKLNPVIRGWANYFRIGVAKELFGKLDHWMVSKALQYTKRIHPKKSIKWQRQQYWGQFNQDRLDSWTFGDKQTGGYLLRFDWFPIERHTLVRGKASPDDPCLKDYWKKRQTAKAKDLTFSKQKLVKRQYGRCPECGETLFNDEELHVHHLLPLSQGGKNSYSNLALVHIFCHQQIHAKTKRAMRDCQQFNSRNLTETNAGLQQSEQEEDKEPCCS